MASLLERLGLQVVSQDDDELQVAVPTWRSDIEREVDLIEEVARLSGYNHIPLTLPRGANQSAGLSLAQRLEERAKEALLRCGLTEIVTMPLQSRAALERAGLAEQPGQAVALRNPLSEDFTRMRTSLLPSLLEVLERNARRPARLFEIGKVYLARPGGAQPDERRHLGLALLDAPGSPHWQKATGNVDFFRLKGMVETLLQSLGTPAPQFYAAKEASFHPGRCATLSLDGQDVGTLGELHPDIAERYGLIHRAYVAVLDFDHVVRHVALGRQFAPISRFPSADRDLALVLPADVPAARVESILRHAGAALLESIRVFDIYTGPPIPEGYKSLALALQFRAERTLTDEEVEAAMTQIRVAAERELDAELRS